jgi:catechol 2,3-dioxygenase-like lactoylglutathione lyase family enzyme
VSVLIVFAPMKKRPAIPRLDGGPQTILLVEDVERSVAFYQEHLRLEKNDGDTERYAEFDSGDGGVLLILKREGTIAPMVTKAMVSPSNALTFTVEDDGYEAWKKWLTKRGVAIDREAKWIHGGRSLFVRDPDGRRIEFKTAAVVKPPTRPPMPIERKKED